MSVSWKTHRRIGPVALIFLLCCLPLAASDPPDSEVNSVSGNIETTDSAREGDGYNVRHVINVQGSPARTATTLSTDSRDDLGPRLAISSTGDTWVAWWRDGDTDDVLIRKRNHSTGTWGDELQVSDKTESSRNPEIAHDGSQAWVAYEFDDAGEIVIAVSAIGDDPNPVGARAYVSATDYSGDCDTLIHHDTGHLWVTWVDSSAEVGWSAYDYSSETWSSEGYESYSSDSVEDARERIREGLLEE